MNSKIQTDIDNLFKKLNITRDDYKKHKNIFDYKLKNKFPTRFSNGKLTITNSTK